MKKLLLAITVIIAVATSCNNKSDKDNTKSNLPPIKEEVKKSELPKVIKIEEIAQNPEGIEYDKNDNTFLLSSLNAGPIIKVHPNGNFKSFTSGESFPLSTAGLQIDYKRNRLLAAGFNGTELYDGDKTTKGTAFLRIYNLKTGVLEKDINLSSLLPEAAAYFANDIAVDNDGNAYISDWFARVIYKVDINGKPSVFWINKTGIPSGPNGLDFHPEGYLLVSLLNVDKKGLYADYGLVKIPLNNPDSAKVVDIKNSGFTGFDGMLITSSGNVIGVTNNGKTPGGNTLIELSGKNNWESAEVINSKEITTSTTVAQTPDGNYFVINQDFSNKTPNTWIIEQIRF